MVGGPERKKKGKLKREEEEEEAEAGRRRKVCLLVGEGPSVDTKVSSPP